MNAVEYGICEFLRDDRAIGLGFALDLTHVVTCAHVVNTALGRRDKRDLTRPGPGDVIRVQFPIGGAPDIDRHRKASVVEWLPGSAGAFESNDIAVLELTESAPAHVPAARPRRYRRRMPVQMWGPQPRRPDGGYVGGELVGEVPGGRIQIITDGRAFRVRPGFSGGPVWATDTDDVVGVLEAYGAGDDAVDAYLLGVDRVAAVWSAWLLGEAGERQLRQQVADLQSRLEKQAEAGEWLQVLATVKELTGSGETWTADPRLAELADHARLELASHPPKPSQRIAGDSQVNAVSWNRDGRRIVIAGHDATARVCDISGTHPRVLLRVKVGGPMPSRVLDAAFSPDSTQLVTATGHMVFTGLPANFDLQSARSKSAAEVWDAVSGERLREIGHDGAVTSVAFSPDGTLLATGCTDRSARIWHTANGEKLQEIGGHDGAVTSVAFSPGGTLLATGCTDRSARIWDTANGEKLQEIGGHDGAVTSVAFSPGGTLLATGCTDRSARIWDTANGQKLLEIGGHDGAVTSVAFSPGGTLLATGCTDRSARIWDTANGQKLLEIGHDDEVTSVAFSPGGTLLATGCRDKSAWIWPVAGM